MTAQVEFEYRGIGPHDTAVEGRIRAANHDQANALLEQMQVRVSELRAREAEHRATVGAISRDEFVLLNEQIIAMVKAGAPLEEGLRHLVDDLPQPRLRRLIGEIAEDLASGTPLEEAIRKREGSFPALYARIIAVGMRTGRLAAVLTGLNRHLEFVGSIRRTVWEALNYPLIVLLFGMIVLWILSRVTGPMWQDIFMDFGTELPLVTKAAFALMDVMVWLLPAAAVLIVALLVVLRLARGPAARRIREQVLLALPVFRTMLRNLLVARFTQALSLMVRAGIPLEESVMLAGEATGSEAVAADSRRIQEALRRGESVPQALQVSRVLPRFLGQTIQIALDRSQLDECLDERSRLYDQRANHGLSTLQAVLMPLAVIFLAGMVGFYILALFMPLTKLITTVNGG